MKRPAMLCLAAALPLLLSACPGEREQTAVEELHETAQQAEGYETPDPAPVTPVPDTSVIDRTVTGSLAQVNRSGVDGGVTVTARNGQSEVLIRVSGAQPGVVLTATVHEGQCDVMGNRVAVLEQIRVDQTGIGTITTLAPIPAAAIMDGLHSIRIYSGPSETVPPVACAAIPAYDPEER